MMPDYQILFNKNIETESDIFNARVTVSRRKGSNKKKKFLVSALSKLQNFESVYNEWLLKQELGNEIVTMLTQPYPSKIDLENGSDIDIFKTKTGHSVINVCFDEKMHTKATEEISDESTSTFVCLSRHDYHIGHMILVSCSGSKLDIYDPNGTPTCKRNEGPYETASSRKSIACSLGAHAILSPKHTRIYINWDNKCIIGSYLVYLFSVHKSWSFDKTSEFFESCPRPFIRRMILSLTYYITH